MLPPFEDLGDLPLGIHAAKIDELLARFGTGSIQREVLAPRLERICRVAFATGQVARLIVFGSFITAKLEPRDVDVSY